MREEAIKQLIGKKNWNKFLSWMRGQTVSCYPDGEIDYYDHNVKAFVTKLKTGYDRQTDVNAWD